MDAEQERARRHAIKLIDGHLCALYDQVTALPIDRFVQLIDQQDPRGADRRSTDRMRGEPDRF